MELLYVWIEKYKNIENQGFNFSPKYRFYFDDKTKTLSNLDEDRSDKVIDDFFGERISNITQFLGDNIHTNELGAYAIALIHYACIFNKNPSGLTNNLLPNPPSGTPIPSQALATYLQNMIWEVVTNYSRTGIKNTISLTETNLENDFEIYPNPANDILQIKTNYENEKTYQIFNSLGKHILTSQENSIDISHLSNGYYLVKVGNEYKKFIKN